jgi:hypothetical protein
VSFTAIGAIKGSDARKGFRLGHPRTERSISWKKPNGEVGGAIRPAIQEVRALLNRVLLGTIYSLSGMGVL